MNIDKLNKLLMKSASSYEGFFHGTLFKKNFKKKYFNVLFLIKYFNFKNSSFGIYIETMISYTLP